MNKIPILENLCLVNLLEEQSIIKKQIPKQFDRKLYLLKRLERKSYSAFWVKKFFSHSSNSYLETLNLTNITFKYSHIIDLLRDDINLCRKWLSEHDTYENYIKDAKFNPRLQSFMLYRACVEKNPYNLSIMKEYQTEEICQIGVDQISHTIKYVKNEFKTYSVCLSALRRQGTLLQHCGSSQTIALCKVALKQNYCALEFVSDKLKTPELFLFAININGKAIKFIFDYQSAEICTIAVKKTAESLCFVDEKFLSEELILIAVNQNGYLLNLIRHYQTEKIVLCALANEANVFKYVNENLKTTKVCLEAINRSCWNLRFMLNCQTLEICRIAVYGNPMLIKWVKEEFQTIDLCTLAVRYDGMLLEFIKNKTKELCSIAFQNNKNASKFFL